MKIGTNLNITQQGYTVKKEKTQEPSDTVILGSNQQDNELAMGQSLKNQKSLIGDACVFGAMIAEEQRQHRETPCSDLAAAGLAVGGLGLLGFCLYKAAGLPALLAATAVGGFGAALTFVLERR
jgi:hypothetical protein